MLMKYTILLCAVLILASCHQNTAENNSMFTNAINETKTKEIVERHFKAFNENDLDAIMADYTEGSILISPGGTCNGLAEIRKDFQGVFKVFPKGATTFKVVRTVIIKVVAYVIWSARTP